MEIHVLLLFPVDRASQDFFTVFTVIERASRGMLCCTTWLTVFTWRELVGVVKEHSFADELNTGNISMNSICELKLLKLNERLVE